MSPWRDFDRSCHPPGKVCFERLLINVTIRATLTRNLCHGLILEEDGHDSCEKSSGTGLPLGSSIAFSSIVHYGRTVQEHARVVRPLQMADFGAIDRIVGAIEDVGLVVDQTHGSGHPVPCLFRPVEVARIASVESQACCHVKETAVGDGVLIVVAVVQRRYLPFEASSTTGSIPARSL